MVENMEKPKIEIVEVSEDNRYGKFVCEPLERGYGTTIGNSLRRILLSSLPGAAITSIRIDGVLHEFSTIPGVRDDVTNIVLNLKQLRLKMFTDEPKVIRIDIEGEKEVTAADITADADIEILNPELHIATLNEDAKLHMEMTVERGKGYVPAEKNKKPDHVIGIIPIDSIFSPVTRVNYTVSDTRVGNVTDYDKLTIEIWTDGSIRPEEAVSRSANILIQHFKLFQNMAGLEDEDEIQDLTFAEEEENDTAKVMEMTIEELDLSVRSYNCLKRANINTVADLTEKTEDDMMKAGYVGSFSHNWDYPFRNGDDSINANLKRIVGEDAAFIAIDPFEDKNGGHTKYVTSTAGDRKIFFPMTNEEPLACLLYLDWISEPEHIQYLQLGDEGVTHEVLEDGSYSVIAATGDPIMNSGFNIDYTITCNGLNLVDSAKTDLSISHSYAGIEPEIVAEANRIANVDARQEEHVNVGPIDAEEGMGTALSEKRDIMYDQCVAAPVEEFDATWDKYMSDYLSSGGQAIIDERDQKWVNLFGDTDSLPN